MSRKIILDCDNTLGIPLKEVDDGLTLLYLLGNPELDLLGITTTFGNGSIQQVFQQTQKLVKKLGVNIPILQGEGQPHNSLDIPAARFLVETVDSNPEYVSLLATGPLGNIFAASKLDPDFYHKIKEIILMGGYIEPVKIGYRDLAELNFSANPQAAQDILHAPCPVTVFSAQACLDAPYGLQDILSADYWSAGLKFIMIQWLIAFGLYTGKFVFYLWDLLPAVYLSKPELFHFKDFRFGSSRDDLRKGMLLESREKNAPEIKLATGIKDQQAFYNHLDETWRNSAERYPP